jgi:peptide/nickel transport system substrate-binding protein
MKDDPLGGRVSQAAELSALAPLLGRRRVLQLMSLTSFAVASPALLAACSSSDTSAGPSDPDALIKSATYLAEDVPTGFDWDGPGGVEVTTQFGINQIMAPLVRYKLVANDDGVLVPDFTQLEGYLAESWEQDGLDWTFHLRSGFKSPAGNEFKADDVVYMVERAKSASGAAPIAWFMYNAGSILGPEAVAEGATEEEKKVHGEVVKIDDRTVKFTQFAPNVLFPAVLTIFALGVLDSTEMKKNATADDPWSHDFLTSGDGAKRAGYGPYVLESLKTGSQAVFHINPGWKGQTGVEMPKIQQVVMNKVPQASVRVGAMKSSNGPSITSSLTSRAWDALSKDKNVKVRGYFGNLATYLMMNYKVPPFDNITLRQAIANAIPYDDIVSGVYFGQARRWKGVTPSIYPGFKEVPIYDTDLDKAKDLLEQAGYPGGAGLEEFADAFTLHYIAERQEQLQPLGTLIQTALADVGIPLKLQPTPQSDYAKRALVDKDLPMAINDSDQPIAPDAGYAIQLYFVTGDKGGLNNMTNYSNADVDTMYLDQAKNESDVAKRDALLATIQEQIMQDVAWVPLVEVKTQVGLTLDLDGYAWEPDNNLRMQYFHHS